MVFFFDNEDDPRVRRLSVDDDDDPDDDLIPIPRSNNSLHQRNPSRLGDIDESSILPVDDMTTSEFHLDSYPEGNKAKIEDFSFLRVIGHGAYGKVFLVRHNVSSKIYAMKTLRKASLLAHRKYTEHSLTEREILSAVQHPFIVKLYFAFQTPRRLYLVLEYIPGGELFTYMAKERMFTEDQARFYCCELILALEHLHNLGIIYRYH